MATIKNNHATMLPQMSDDLLQRAGGNIHAAKGDVCGLRTPMDAGDLPSDKGFGFDRADRTPERIAKAKAFWQKQIANRKLPGHCCRCGKKHEAKTRQCPKCLAYQAKYRGKLTDKDAKLTGSVVVAMVKQMRREMDKMQLRFKQWQKAAYYRRDLKYRINTMRKKYFKPVDNDAAIDYLRQTNHAYSED